MTVLTTAPFAFPPTAADPADALSIEPYPGLPWNADLLDAGGASSPLPPEVQSALAMRLWVTPLPADRFPQIGAVATDPLGGVVVVGTRRIVPTASPTEGMAWRLDPRGGFVWNTSFAAPPGGRAFAFQVALDGMGNSYVNVFTQQGSSALPTTSSIVKLDALGVPKWNYSVTGVFPATTYFAGFAADEDGNLYVSATTNWDFEVFKLSPEGRILWRNTYPDPLSTNGASIALDAKGNVHVLSLSLQPNLAYTTDYVRLDPDGKELARFRLDHWFRVFPTRVVAHSTGEAFVTTHDWNWGSFTPHLHKVDEAGNLVWRRQIALPGTSGNYGPLALDLQGNLFAGGTYRTTKTEGFVDRYDLAGNFLGRLVDLGGNATHEFVNSISLTPDGRLAVAGQTIEGSTRTTYVATWVDAATPTTTALAKLPKPPA